MTKPPKPLEMPTSGGSYTRDKNGNLKLKHKPTQPKPIIQTNTPEDAAFEDQEEA